MASSDIEGEINILDPERIKLYRDNFDVLRLRIEGDKEYPEVKAIRSFPLSDAGRFISLREVKDDGKSGREIGIIRDSRELDPQSREVLEQELERAYFTPKITKINDIEEEYGILRWDVETDRGPRVFEVRDRESIRTLPQRRVVINDIDGNRFEIPDYDDLDSESIALLEPEI